MDRVLTGTMQRPALTVEGLPVQVKTHGFDVLVNVAGPVVPGEGLPYQPGLDHLHLDRDDEERHR